MIWSSLNRLLPLVRPLVAGLHLQASERKRSSSGAGRDSSLRASTRLLRPGCRATACTGTRGALSGVA